MIPEQWCSPCGKLCTKKYAALMQIPWRVFCKKGCDADGETWEECLEECNEICFKDPVLKDQQWSAYIDRSPGAENYSVIRRSNKGYIGERFIQFHPINSRPTRGIFARSTDLSNDFEQLPTWSEASSYKFEVPTAEAEQIQPNRPLKLVTTAVSKPPEPKPSTMPKPQIPLTIDDSEMPCTSA